MTEELFREDPYCKACDAKVVALSDQGIVLDRTVFYASGGGQPGDSGWLRRADGVEVPIVDARKALEDGTHLHIPGIDAVALRPGDSVEVVIDWDRRHRLMRMHTCLHLLCSLIEGGVTGGSVGDSKGRLDFDLPDATLDKEALSDALNKLIAEDRPVRPRWVTDTELSANPDLVRTMAVKPPSGSGRVRLIDIDGVDLQPCGGTHVARTGEIGPVAVTKIEKKGRHNRRVNVAFRD